MLLMWGIKECKREVKCYKGDDISMHWEVKCVGIEMGAKRKGLQKGRSLVNEKNENVKDKVNLDTYEVNTGWSCEAVIDHAKWASVGWSDSGKLNWQCRSGMGHMRWTKKVLPQWAPMSWTYIQWSVSNVHICDSHNLRWTFGVIQSSGQADRRGQYEVDTIGQWASIYIYEVDSWGLGRYLKWTKWFDHMRMRWTYAVLR